MTLLSQPITEPRLTWQHLLMLEEPGRPRVVAKPLPPALAADEVLLRSSWSTFENGATMAAYHGIGPFRDQEFDPELEVFLPAVRPPWPCALGSTTVGRVLAVGAAVAELAPGDEVFGPLPVADRHAARATDLSPLDGLTPEQALCLDPAVAAVGGVRDAGVGYGDRVLVTGAGPLAAFTVLFLKRAGVRVWAASGFANRRQLLRSCGADDVLDRDLVADLGVAVKRRVPGGVDAAVECSGRYPQLRQALRAVRRGGCVVAAGSYVGTPELWLDEEFRQNALTLKASGPAGRRDDARLHAEVIDSFRCGRLPVPEGLLHPTLPFERAAEAVRLIDECPDRAVKVVIAY